MLQGRCVRQHIRGGRRGNRRWIKSYFIASYMKYYMKKRNYNFLKKKNSTWSWHLQQEYKHALSLRMFITWLQNKAEHVGRHP